MWHVLYLSLRYQIIEEAKGIDYYLVFTAVHFWGLYWSFNYFQECSLKKVLPVGCMFFLVQSSIYVRAQVLKLTSVSFESLIKLFMY